jgi:hypothetical protein
LGVSAMLPSVLVEMIALPFRFRLSTSRSPTTFTEPVIVSVVVSIVTAVEALMSTVGAVISNSTSASMSN